MINAVVAFDDNDQELGDYFEQSYNDLNHFLASIEDIVLTPISGLECTEEHLIGTLQSFDEEKFVFVGLMHGNEEQLATDNDILVDIENLAHFNKSFFYSPACCTAVELGVELIASGCYSYVGCNQETFATYEDYNEVYINCENFCLKQFLNSQLTIEICFNNMLNYFDEQIALLSVENDEILVAMELIGNKDSFVLLGNKNLTKSDLM